MVAIYFFLIVLKLCDLDTIIKKPACRSSPYLLIPAESPEVCRLWSTRQIPQFRSIRYVLIHVHSVNSANSAIPIYKDSWRNVDLRLAVTKTAWHVSYQLSHTWLFVGIADRTFEVRLLEFLSILYFHGYIKMSSLRLLPVCIYMYLYLKAVLVLVSNFAVLRHFHSNI